MKKLILMLMAIFALTIQTTEAQNDTIQKTLNDTIQKVTIETLNQKLDTFLEVQQKTNAVLEKKINKANTNLQNLQNQSSLRWLLKDTIPILILLIIGGFVTAIIYILSVGSFRKRKIKYETLIRCTEMTGQVPDIIDMSNKSQRSYSIHPSARIYLFLSIICVVVGFITLIISVNVRGISSYFCMMMTFMFFVVGATLFVQFNQRNREDNRAN